ncbi:hypothetical protein CHUAL_000261 [Chamberlinius hualienensis]
MAVLSVLCRNLSRKFGGIVAKSPALGVPTIKPSFFILKDGIRHSGGHHKKLFVVTASRFQWRKLKDIVHFYVMLGIIPIALLVTYVNIFIGPAELQEIPEGYVPKDWEYYKGPIQRWFAKYVYITDQEHYEKFLHYVTEVEETRQCRLLERKVRGLMVEKNDYKAWYYQPITGKYHRLSRQEEDIAVNERQGVY